ncbi:MULTISPECIES: hypothetical protein [Streptosporangium]|uniref:Conjugal transfer protein TraI n=1 Tax=Streptosporangium brasiliense TaxID=47480 RepID=A0ABT9RMF2_9ACTN|nr:hypothetical protein [Streptosporangium brasiliense]MDP9870478.1 hypothetical protein [Streptosporangium brasiliense]
MSITPPISAPMPDPEEVARGLAELELYVAAKTPVLPAPAPTIEVLEEGETKRVRELRARVAEAHRLVELQDDDAPLLVDTSKVRKRRVRVAEAARLYQLSQDPAELAWRDARVRRTTTVMAMSAATIALGVSSIGVQASVAKGLKLGDDTVGWWAAFGVEPILSLPLLAAVTVQAYAAMRGRAVDRKSPEGRKLLKAEALLLGLTLVLNCWPAIKWSGFDLLPLVVHSLGPLGAVTAIWLLPTLWAILGALPAGRGTAGGTGRLIRENASDEPGEEYTQYTPGGVDIEALADRAQQLIDAGQLPASPGIHKIRHALGCGVDVARRVQIALGGGA